MKSLIGSVLLAAVLALGASTPSFAKTLRWGEHLPECCSQYAKATKWMIKEVDNRSHGDLKINITWGGVLATVGEIPNAIQNDIIDMGDIVTPYFPDQFVINNAIPFFWPQPKSQKQLGELMLKWYKEFPSFSKELAKYNIHLVTIRPLPPYGMICTKPIRTLADFKGKRIRSYGVALPAMLEALGAVPVGMADVDAYQAMQNNILDCSVADIALVEAFKLDDVGKYFIDVPMGASWGHIIGMNQDVYNSLSPSQKKVIDEMKYDHLNELLKDFGVAQKRILKEWKDTGKVEVIHFPRDVFLKATLGNPKVQAIRNSWVPRAVAAGMPEANAKQVVKDLTQ